MGKIVLLPNFNKKSKLEEILSEKSISIKKISQGELISNSIDNYNYIHQKNTDITTISDDKLNHIVLNYVRHRLIGEYDKLLRKYFNENGNNETYVKIFTKINMEIVKVYPFLKKASFQQINAKNDQLKKLG